MYVRNVNEWLNVPISRVILLFNMHSQTDIFVFETYYTYCPLSNNYRFNSKQPWVKVCIDIIFWITYFLNRLYFYFSEIKDPVDFGFSDIFLPVWCTSGWHALKLTAFDIIRLCKDNYTAIYSLQRKVPSTSETKIYRLSYQWYFVLTTWRKKCWDAFQPGSHVDASFFFILDKEQRVLQIPLYTSNALLCFLETHISQLKYTFTLFDRLLMVQYFGMIDFALISITFYTFLVKSYITIN